MKSAIATSVYNWTRGIRFYIAITTLVITGDIYWYISSVYGNASFAAIRLQETYAWLSLALIIVALAIGPVTKLLPLLPGKSILRDARRMVGISAAWFASAHVFISFFNQFHAANPLTLPVPYQQAFAVGSLALVILLALAMTSFDGAFRRLGPWWFRLHRLIYLAVLLILFHAFSIGVHAVMWTYLLPLSMAIAGLFAIHFYLSFGPGREPTTLQSVGLCYGLLITIAVLAYGYTQHLGFSKVTGSSSAGQYEVR